MPRIDKASEEAAADIVALTVKAVGGVEAAFQYLQGIGNLLIKHDGFGIIVRKCRREAVINLFTGNNYGEVAKKLKISTETVRNDIRDYYRKKVR